MYITSGSNSPLKGTIRCICEVCPPPAIMACFAQLRGRLGVARLLLAELKDEGGPALAATSQLQAESIAEHLQKGGKQLDAEERADLATQVQSAGFESKDVQLILQFLVTTKQNGRRDAQDYTAFLEYVSSKEWDLIDAGSESEIDDISCQVLARLNCLNPCEQTKKMLTPADLVAVHKTSAVSDDVKVSKTYSAGQVMKMHIMPNTIVGVIEYK